MSILEDALKILDQSLDPDGWGSFVYYGDRPLGKTWGIVGPHRTRDSEVLEISNYECIIRDLKAEFPDDDDKWEVLGSSHWAVGWVDSVMCQIFTDHFIENYMEEDGYFDRMALDEDDFHPVFVWLYEVGVGLRDDYPVYDEMDFSEREYEDQIDSLQYITPYWADQSGDNPSVVFSWLMDHGVDYYGLSEDEVANAYLNLGFVDDEEDALEWWADNVGVVGVSPESFGQFIVLWNMGQMTLEV